MTNADDVLGHKFRPIGNINVDDKGQSKKRCIESNINDDIDEVDSNEYAALVKLDCNIQCNQTLNVLVSVCRV